MRSTYGNNFTVGKIDDKTAVVTGKVFDMDKMKNFFTSHPQMKEMEKNIGAKHVI